ncbi:hypothetical protein SAMN05216312_113118 [Cohnella sp. OV330]|uniref:hypothetical protein n=1 Tax=Cohnella sp. OV330 TaxID=1855288 RepID=UPI0008E7FC1D|nr:hypothetical protein [Cohnella sp. OV330]SFB56172.1 hypothetical protein SAMN05216312_113118 [Cohnella sp. OV330]
MSDVSKYRRVIHEALASEKPIASFDQLWMRADSRTRRPLRRYWLVALPLLAALLAGACTAVYQGMTNWSNTTVSFSDKKDDLTDMLTPLEAFDGKRLLEGYPPLSLQETRRKAPIPIRIPVLPAGWTEVRSTGMDPGNAEYWTFLLDPQGRRAVVRQAFDSSYTVSLKKKPNQTFNSEYPHGSKFIKGFGDDLAILMNLQKGRWQMMLYHKEAEKEIVTCISIWSMDPDEAVALAHLYLEAPSS